MPTRHKPKRFEAMAKAMGSKWKALTMSQRRRYEELAATDQERYRKEKQEYRDKMVRESALGAAYLERKRLADLQAQVAEDATKTPTERTQPHAQLHPPEAAFWSTSVSSSIVTANSHKESLNEAEQAPYRQPVASVAPVERNEVIDTAQEILFLQRQLSNLEHAQTLLERLTGPSALGPAAMPSRSPSAFQPPESAGMHLQQEMRQTELQVPTTHQVLPARQVWPAYNTQLQPAPWYPPFEIPAAAASFGRSIVNTSSDEGPPSASREPSGAVTTLIPTEAIQGLGSEPALDNMISLSPQQQVQLLLVCAKVVQELSSVQIEP
jgi:HMG (high mobility group) box